MRSWKGARVNNLLHKRNKKRGREGFTVIFPFLFDDLYKVFWRFGESSF